MIAFVMGTTIKLIPNSKEEAFILARLAEEPDFAEFILVEDGLGPGPSLLIRNQGGGPK